MRHSCAIDRRHVFRRKGIPALFRLEVLEEGIPKANMKYTLTVNGVDLIGVTDGEGVLQQYLPPNTRHGELLMEDLTIIRLAFGDLNPSNEIVGVQNRLNNLGFSCGEGGASGELDDGTRNALRLFQARMKLPQSGEADARTIQKLEEVHDLTGTLRRDPSHGS